MTTRFAPLWFLAAGALAAVLAPHSQAADNEARAVIKALDRALLSSELAGRITSLLPLLERELSQVNRHLLIRFAEGQAQQQAADHDPRPYPVICHDFPLIIP